MRLMRVGPVGAERPVAWAGPWLAYDLTGITADIDGEFLSSERFEEALLAVRLRELPELNIAGQRVGAPIARPHAVLCVGMNYATHAAEAGRQPPTDPVVVYKAPNTVVGPNDEILLPPGSTSTDWEAELGVVIGRRARYLSSTDEAMDHVAGFVASNDVSERDFQLNRSGGQWATGKSCETFNPLGPWLVTTEEVPHPQSLRVRSFVNGEPRQDAGTDDMIFGIAQLVWHLSQFTVLEPGDLINTGTPAGVAQSGRFPFLSAGDVVEIEIDGMGRQRNRCRPAPPPR
jgi:2-keto-4-pentenoate hydratase/2-oxohepta-3-ene-1,7-dioic acid hydratase in catechol pathway